MTLDTRTAAPAEVVTPIKPSEALRLGRLDYPEHTPAAMFMGERGACALGAMQAGWGLRPSALDGRLATFGLSWADIAFQFDTAEVNGEDGDRVVIAYLEERGL